MRSSIPKKILMMMLTFAMVFTMIQLLDIGVQTVNAAAATAPGGAVASNNEVGLDDVKVDTVSAETALGASNISASYNSGSKTLTIILNKDINLRSPLKFVKGENGGKIILNLNGHTITGKMGSTGNKLSEAVGGNAIEIAADEFDVEIKGPGYVIGGKGGKLSRNDYSGYIVGVYGGSAVFFCNRVDKVHDVTGTFNDIIDEGYHPETLEHGLSITGAANLVGGAGADVTLDDWKNNLSIGDNDLFTLSAGSGGTAIGQVFSSSNMTDVLEELSYAKIDIKNGSVTGGAGGNINLGDQLLTTTDIQKISEIQQFMQGKSASYDFDSNVKDEISFTPGIGGDGIAFHAGRKFIDVEADGTVSGGAGGRFTCSEKASMVKSIETSCGNGGKGIYVCGDTGLKNTKPTLTDASWGEKSKISDDVGIYIAGSVIGGASPSTTLLADSSGAGGEGIDNDFEDLNLCSPYSVEYGHRPLFDADRGIVLVDNGGKVIGGASGAPDETTIAGGGGADAMNGGATGGYFSDSKISASYFVINGEITGGYGSNQGGAGFHMKEEREDTSSGDSVYFCGAVYGNGTIRGGDTGEWPHIGTAYSTDSDRIITYHGYDGDQVIRGVGIFKKYGSHEEATTIGSDLKVYDGEPAKLMTTSGTFSVTPIMTSFPTGTAPDSKTKLSCTVTKPNGYNGKVYIVWSAEYEDSTPRIVRTIEGANGAYNNISILSNADYPYGWKQVSYGYDYYINVATREHIAESIKYNDNREVHIYCHALLEDGRFVDNDDIWFSKERRSTKGWDGSSGGGDQPSGDQQAAENVENLIWNLNWYDIKLSDEDDVIAARAAYDALTPAQKVLVDPDVYQLLLDCEAEIEELKGNVNKVSEIITLIEDLPDAADINGGNVDDVSDEIQIIRSKIEALTPEQQQLLSEDTDSIEKLTNVEAKVIEVKGGEHQHLVIHVPEKQATCTNKGNVEYWYCLTCKGDDAGKKYSSNDLDPANDITDSYQTPIDENAHVPREFAARAANCVHEGNVKYYICTECDKYFRDEACTNEIFDESEVVIPIDPNAHSWQNGAAYVSGYGIDSYSRARTDKCKNCGKTRTVNLGNTAYKGGLPKVKISKPKAGKKKVTVKWKQISTKNKKRIGGVEIQITGNGINKVVTAGKGKTSKTIKGLKSKKKYKVRVRSYKGSGTTKKISKWSAWKTVKIK